MSTVGSKSLFESQMAGGAGGGGGGVNPWFVLFRW